MHYSIDMKTYTLLLSAFFLLACSKQEPESPMPTPQAPVSYTITISASAGGSVVAQEAAMKQARNST